MKSYIIKVRDIYIPLMSDFLEGKLSAVEFAHQFIKVKQSEPFVSSYPEKIYTILQSVFLDSNDYEIDPDVQYCEIDETEFQHRTAINLAKLKAIIGTY